MKKVHPLDKCRKIVSDPYKQLEDLKKVYTLSLNEEPPNEDQTDRILVPDFLSNDYSEFLERHLHIRLKSTFFHVKENYRRLITDQEKYDYIKYILKEVEGLIIELKKKEDAVDNLYFEIGYRLLRKLYRDLHQFFDDKIFLLDHDLEKKSKFGKIMLNLNRSELLHLIIVLQDLEIINKYKYRPHTLGKFIENNFLYRDEVTGLPQEMARVKKSLEEISDVADRHKKPYNKILDILRDNSKVKKIK